MGSKGGELQEKLKLTCTRKNGGFCRDKKPRGVGLVWFGFLFWGNKQQELVCLVVFQCFLSGGAGVDRVLAVSGVGRATDIV